MTRRMLFFLAVLAGSVVMTGGALATFQPFGAAETETDASTFVPEEVSLDEGLAPEEATALNDGMQVAADAGPNSVRCTGSGAIMACTVVPDKEVIPALKGGEELYGRTVYGNLEKGIASGNALFASDELVCASAASDGTIACSPAGKVQPAIPAGETIFVTYAPYNATVDKRGNVVGRSGIPTVPLVRASG